MPTHKADLENSVVPEAVYQIKIVLLGTRPPIWRRVLVPGDFTLAQLHSVIQAAIGWENCHLHEFRIGGRRFGVPSANSSLIGGPSCINERKARVADVLDKPRSKATYTYDFGDSWEHVLSVEKVLVPEADIASPLCTDGERHGPPEDCGGIPGFYSMLEALADPTHEDHEDMREWIGSFDPEGFSVDAVNQRLRKIFRGSCKPKPARLAQRKSATPSIQDLHALLHVIEARLEQPQTQRQRIRPDEKVPLELNDYERALILEHTFADEDLTSRLQVVPKPDERPVFRFTLDDLDELAGCVAFEANHTKDKKLRKKLDHLFARITDVLESYTDQDD